MIGGQRPSELSGQTATATVNDAICGNVALERGATAVVRGPLPVRGHSFFRQHPGAPPMPGKEEEEAEEEEEKPWVPPSMTFKDGTKCFSERAMHY